MSGQLRKCAPKDPVAPHTHVTMAFTQGGQLRYVDPRTFGELYVVAKDAEDPDGIWFTEVWDSEQSHAASLKLPFTLARVATVPDRDGQGTGFTQTQTNKLGTDYQPSLIDLDTAVAIVLSVTTKYREPETTRRAHRLVNRLRVAPPVQGG